MDVQDVPKSILQVPVVSNVIILAWATGADLYIEELDETFLASLDKLKQEMSRFYPHFPYTTKIHAKKIIKNTFANEGIGLLFSGGIDSTASYIQNRSKKPNLIIIWGLDISLDEDDEFWSRVKKSVLRMARREKIEINFMKTNLHEFLNEPILDICFHRYIESSWWLSIQFAISTAGLNAPLTVVKSIGTLLMASGITSDYKDPEKVDFYQTPGWASNYIHGNLGWADTITLYDAIELTRQEKIGLILKEELTKKDHNFELRVCGFPYYWVAKDDAINCNNCEKCWRTIVGLVVAGIDPNHCGFRIDENFFPALRHQFISNQKEFLKSEGILYLWQDIQKYIPTARDLKNSKDLYNSNKFFNWFRNFDLSKRGINPNRTYTRRLYFVHVYNHLPQHIRVILVKVQKKLVKWFKLISYV